MTEKTTSTTPDSISADELKDLKRKAEKTKEETFFNELMGRGHELVNIICEAKEYGEFNDVQALALQSIYNLRCKYEQFCKAAAKSEDNPRNLMRGMRAWTQIDTAFDLIESTLINLEED